MNLTGSQEKAINHFKGPALVVAGPGAGKTFVITERVKNLIQKKKVDSSKILVTTFTEKAATELKVRLAKTIGDEAKKIHISTIHSFCKDISQSIIFILSFTCFKLSVLPVLKLSRTVTSWFKLKRLSTK